MTRQDYDELAAAYAPNRSLHPMVLDQLIALGPLTASSSVLEIGCGTGNYIRAIAAATGAQCTGVDPSTEMLRIATQSGSGKVILLLGSAEALPVPDEAFDLAFSVDVIHHVQNRLAAARELHRVVRPGGSAVIVTESEDDLRHRTPQVAYFPDVIDVELGRYPTVEEVEGNLTSAGFDIQQEIAVSMPHEVADLAPYRARAFSSLHLIPVEAYQRGLARMEHDLQRGPIPGVRRYTMVVGRRP